MGEIKVNANVDKPATQENKKKKKGKSKKGPEAAAKKRAEKGWFYSRSISMHPYTLQQDVPLLDPTACILKGSYNMHL